MAEIVYSLCALTALACAVLLFRGYRRSGSRMLFWSALCFACLTISNALLVVDRLVLPEPVLNTWRLVPTLAGLVLLVYGLTQED
ncbi:MAG TPA: DUF5985 family protein [Xanthomonadales bacterium]|nr:DUF5985 family protein [Xanthomonadales bacterium]